MLLLLIVGYEYILVCSKQKQNTKPLRIHDLQMKNNIFSFKSMPAKDFPLLMGMIALIESSNIDLSQWRDVFEENKEFLIEHMAAGNRSEA